MSAGATTAVGIALGVAYGAASGRLALSIAVGAALGAILEFAAHAVRLAKRRREQSAGQP